MNSAEYTTIACVTAFCVALLIALSMIASCTRDVAKTAAQVELSCYERGLAYVQGFSPSGTDPGSCVRPSK